MRWFWILHALFLISEIVFLFVILWAMPTISRHKWYTLSGLLSRGFSYLSVKLMENPNEIALASVFAYGMVELFGVVRSVKIMAKFRRIQIAKSKKIRPPVSFSNAGSTANVPSDDGTHL